jgi:cell wall-associated NlpC family hydrolase
MIEQSHRPLLPTGSSDLEALQRRANRRRLRYQQASGSLPSNKLQAFGPLGPRFRSVLRLPTRFLLHAVIVLILPVAVALSHIQAGVMLPVAQPLPPQATDDLAAPIAPLSLDAQGVIGDEPLADDAEIPVPLSLVSRNEALAPVVVDAQIAGDRIFVRNGPGTEYDAVARISKDTPVQVIGKYNDWYQVREGVDKPVFWVSGALLNIPEGAEYTLFEVAQEAIPPMPPPKIATVREDGLQMRDGPGTNYVPMSKFNTGTQLELLERWQDWYHIGVPGGADGWVKGEFLAIDPSINARLLEAETIPDPNPALVGVINDNLVNLRLGPDSKYDKAGALNTGIQVDLVGKYNDWFKVKLGDGKQAWVFRDFLNVTERVLRRVPVTKDFPALPKPAARVKAKGNTGSRGSAVDYANIPASGDVASYATNFVGAAYRYGAAGPRAFDCSGLTSYVYAKHGVRLPRTAAAQYGAGTRINDRGSLAPGDLVFFTGTAGGKRGISHVGIYIGGGRIVHAMSPKYGVQVSSLNDKYWSRHYYGAVRPGR